MPVKINRVHLKDYRIHENNEFIFDRGINLILGKNGSGKSSILEALGLAMFDADIRSNITDAVRYGQKTAVITVEFEGNDDNTYVVERKIGQVSSFKLSLKGESAARINGKEQVLSKIKELANITANERSLFQNVITAYQNKITGIFEEKPTRREIIFNQIFDTAIYREMYEQFLKQARDEYQQQIALKNQSISDLLAKL
jgi:exonuclease SbcC